MDSVAVQKSIRLVWRQGIFSSAMLSIMEYFLIPFALFLGATPMDVGLLVAIPNLVGSFSQLMAVKAVAVGGGRVPLLFKGAMMQAALLIPIGLLAFNSIRWNIALLIFLVILFRILEQLIFSAWGGVVSNYLPPEERGQFLGRRSQMMNLVAMATLFFAGYFLHWIKTFSEMIGFVALFFAAALFRYLCARSFGQLVDPPHEKKEGSDFTFWMFIRRMRESNFVKFVLYVAGMTFVTQIAAPYFTVFMLRDLQMSYAEYMAINVATVLGAVVGYPLWGKHGDHVGNASILKITSCLIPLIPLLWLFSSSIYYLIVVEFVSGFAWSGFNLSSINFVFDAVVPEKRVRCLGYFNMITGVALFFGSSLGGFLAERLPPLLGHRICTLFLLSGFLRIVVYFFFSKKFKEVRESLPSISNWRLFFSVVGIRPLPGREK